MLLFGAQLQVALDPRRRVVGALALVAVRQQQGDAGTLAPLRSPDEMNSSRIVCAPLAKSPNCASHSDQCFGAGHRVAVLEAHAAYSDSSES